MKILIIGGVAAGLKSAAKARRDNPEAKITVFERGPIISYGSCGMPYYVSGEIPRVSALMETGSGVLRDATYFKETQNIDVKIRSEVTRINRDVKTIDVLDLNTGEAASFSYDKLVIATGATPVIPPLDGIHLKNVFSLWHPSDAEAIRQGIDSKSYHKAVIIGAGLIGIETAEALRLQGLDVSLIEMKSQIFPAFLDEEIARSGEKHLQAKGVRLFCEERVEKILGVDQVTGVKTDKQELPSDLVIFAIGSRPNIDLAKNAGLKIGETGAIWVNEELQTSDPDIYAGGDCVETIHRISGQRVYLPMGSTANKQGRVIGANLSGAHQKFGGVLGTTVVKVFDQTIGKTGLSPEEAQRLGYDPLVVTVTGADRAHYMTTARPLLLKLIVNKKDRKVLGLQGIGEGEVSKRIDVAATAITLGATLEDLFDIDLSYSPPYNSPIDMLATAATAAMNKLD